MKIKQLNNCFDSENIQDILSNICPGIEWIIIPGYYDIAGIKYFNLKGLVFALKKKECELFQVENDGIRNGITLKATGIKSIKKYLNEFIKWIEDHEYPQSFAFKED